MNRAAYVKIITSTLCDRATFNLNTNCFDLTLTMCYYYNIDHYVENSP